MQETIFGRRIFPVWIPAIIIIASLHIQIYSPYKCAYIYRERAERDTIRITMYLPDLSIDTYEQSDKNNNTVADSKAFNVIGIPLIEHICIAWFINFKSKLMPNAEDDWNQWTSWVQLWTDLVNLSFLRLLQN